MELGAFRATIKSDERLSPKRNASCNLALEIGPRSQSTVALGSYLGAGIWRAVRLESYMLALKVVRQETGAGCT